MENYSFNPSEIKGQPQQEGEKIIEWLVKMKNEADEYEYKLNKEGKTNLGCFYLGKAAAFSDVLLMLNKVQNVQVCDASKAEQSDTDGSQK